VDGVDEISQRALLTKVQSRRKPPVRVISDVIKVIEQEPDSLAPDIFDWASSHGGAVFAIAITADKLCGIRSTSVGARIVWVPEVDAARYNRDHEREAARVAPRSLSGCRQTGQVHWPPNTGHWYGGSGVYCQPPLDAEVAKVRWPVDAAHEPKDKGMNESRRFSTTNITGGAMKRITPVNARGV
jgi:hypothetical protein